MLCLNISFNSGGGGEDYALTASVSPIDGALSMQTPSGAIVGTVRSMKC